MYMYFGDDIVLGVKPPALKYCLVVIVVFLIVYVAKMLPNLSSFNWPFWKYFLITKNFRKLPHKNIESSSSLMIMRLSIL